MGHRDIKPHNLFVVGSRSAKKAMRAHSADGAILSDLYYETTEPRLDARMHRDRAKSEDFWPLRAPEAASQLVGEQPMNMLRVKLGDFGTAIKIHPGKLCRDKVGTPAFMAPEMHLLPGRSPGYNHKVDVWATGVVMVFLLANQYPFLDGAGRLLRDKLVIGDIPLWETGIFQEMFVNIQEAAGIRRKRPSKISRDLASRLLAPAARQRISPNYALQHAWFTSPLPGEEVVEPEPPPPSILDWKEFEESLSTVKRDFQWAMDMFSGSPQHGDGIARIASAPVSAPVPAPLPEAPRPSPLASFPACAHVAGAGQQAIGIVGVPAPRAYSYPREHYQLLRA